MNNRSTPQSPADSAIDLGRIALEALHSREEAARYHAESLELQLALTEAESGNSEKLTQWLEKHSELKLSTSPTRAAAATTWPAYISTPFVKPVSFSDDGMASTETNRVPLEASDRPLSSPSESPWQSMVAATLQRRDQIAASHTDHSLLASFPSSGSATAILDAPASSPIAKTIDSEKVDSKSIDSKTADPAVNAIPGKADGLANSASPQSSPATKSLTPIKGEKPPRNTSAEVLRRKESLKLDEPASKPKRSLWMSSSFIGSTLVHILALVGMSAYVITIAQKTEPKAIVASPVDTEQVSMETPVEFSEAEIEPLDVTEPVPPSMSSFSSDSVVESTSNIQLPTSMVGVSLPKQFDSASSAVENAINSNSSQLNPNNAAQFFGVKATGNTFCYVVDCSPSMKRDNAFAAAKAELVRSLSSMKPKQRYFIVFFAKEIQALELQPGAPEAYPVYATPENLQKTLGWIERVRVQDNGKAPTDALEMAIEMDPDGVFLLFDGDTTVDVPAFLRRVNRSNDIIIGEQPRVPIHTLGFYDEDHQAIMKQIAKENLGTFRFVPKPIQK